jgi:hypothetical protein
MGRDKRAEDKWKLEVREALKRDAVNPGVPIPGSNRSAINQAGIMMRVNDAPDPRHLIETTARPFLPHTQHLREAETLDDAQA